MTTYDEQGEYEDAIRYLEETIRGLEPAMRAEGVAALAEQVMLGSSWLIDTLDARMPLSAAEEDGHEAWAIGLSSRRIDR